MVALTEKLNLPKSLT